MNPLVVVLDVVIPRKKDSILANDCRRAKVPLFTYFLFRLFVEMFVGVGASRVRACSEECEKTILRALF